MYVSITEAANVLRTSPAALRQRIARGSIPAEAIIQHSKGGAILLDLDLLLERGRSDVPPQPRAQVYFVGTGRIRPESSGIPNRWVLDSYGVTTLGGQRLPRKRWTYEGTRDDAEVALRARLQELAGFSGGPEASGAQEAKAPLRYRTDVRTPVRKGRGLTLRRYAKEVYFPWLRREKIIETSTILVRERMFEHRVFPCLGDDLLVTVNTPASIYKIRNYLSGLPLKNTYRNLVLITLKSLLTAATRHSAQAVPPLQTKVYIELFRKDADDGMGNEAFVDGIEVGGQRTKRLSDKQVKRIWDHCDKQGEAATFWRVFFGLGLLCGLRPGEAVARKWDDVDFVSGRILVNSIVCPETGVVVERTKGKRSAWVPVPPSLLNDLRALQPSGDPRNPYILGVRSTTSEAWQSAWASQNIQRFTRGIWGAKQAVNSYHRLRHTFCSSLADRGIPVHVIQRMARHANITTTYGYIAPSVEAMQAAVDALDRR